METDLFPSLLGLKGAPAGILLALLVQPGPLGVSELSERTGWSTATVSKGLRKLATLGLARNRARYNGWSLTTKAQRMFAPGICSAPVHGAHAQAKTGSVKSALAEERGPRGSAKSALAERREHKKIAPERERLALPESLSLEEESSLIKRFINSASDSKTGEREELAPEEARGAVAGILAASESLFGEPVLGPPDRYPDPAVLLAAIAEAYDRRALLRKPARVVYGMLKHGYTPAARYLEDPLRYLPANFLAAAGLPAPAPSPEPEEDGQPQEDWEPAPDLPPQPEPHPSLAIQAGDRPGRTAAEAWRMARAALESLLPRHVFVARLEPLRLHSYEPETNTFTLEAPDPAQRDWLAGRLATALERALLGACNRAARVVFVVEEEGE